MIRIENQTPDGSIPYVSYPNKSVFIHGSTFKRDWRTKILTELTPYSVLVLDPWKTAWSNYSNALSTSIEDFENYATGIITGGTPDPGTGLVPGYVPPAMPDIANFPIFWEGRNILACDFQFFNFDYNEEIASHILMLMANTIKKDPTKVIVRIPPSDWRINVATFLKDLPRENYFGNEDLAITRLKEIMAL